MIIKNISSLLVRLAGSGKKPQEELFIKGKTKFYYGDSLHKYTVEHDDYYVIVFRGSENKFDWLNDFTFNAVDFNHTNIHQGFFCALEAELNPRLQYDKPVYITHVSQMPMEGNRFGFYVEPGIMIRCDKIVVKRLITNKNFKGNPWMPLDNDEMPLGSVILRGN